MRCCSNCRAPCNIDFKQIVNLKGSGLHIYGYNPGHTRTNITHIILHNVGKKELQKNNYISELCQYKTKCYQCQNIIHRIRNLLDNIDIIRKNEVLALCDHCKTNSQNECRRCEYMLKKFMSSSVQHERLIDDYAVWQQKVKDILLTIVDETKTCPHRMRFVQNSDMELRKLIHLLKTSPPKIKPRVDSYSATKIDLPIPIDEKAKQELLEAIDEVRLYRVPTPDTASIASACMCRYFDKRKRECTTHPKVSLEMPIFTEKDSATSDDNNLYANNKQRVPSVSDIVDEKNVLNKNILTSKIGLFSKSESKKTQNDKLKKDTQKNYLSTSPKKGVQKVLSNHLSTSSKKGVQKDLSTSPENGVQKDNIKIDEEPKLMLQLIKNHKEKVKSKSKLINMPKIADLPELPVRSPKPSKSELDISENSGSTLICTPRDILPSVMIRGARLVPLDLKSKPKVPVFLEPIIFKNQIEFKTKVSSKTSSSEILTEEIPEIHEDNKGIIKYALSNKEFIDNGWTKLPTTKIMRQMNIYKMESASPDFDWFKRHSQKRVMFYDSGEILAEINEKGCGGKWYYKNGSIALDFRNSQGDVKDKYRYIIFDLKEDEYVKNTKTPITILAYFNYLGSGVVYDHSGKVRLQYNQSEGIVFDKKIGAPSKWKWHSLNDPPVLRNVYIDNTVRDHSLLQKPFMPKHTMIFDEDLSPKLVDEEMLRIEFENFVKEKAEKIMQKMTPFKIRMKALKINDYFSLRVIDQANIYILFRSGNISFKLNIGMLLKSNEIIDTVNVDVSTPYDITQEPQSIGNI